MKMEQSRSESLDFFVYTFFWLDKDFLCFQLRLLPYSI